MLNSFAKLLLVSTSLAPVLGAVAVIQYANDARWTQWLWWLVAAIVLVGVCWLMLRYAARNAQRHKLPIGEFERSDQEVVAFLLAYLLPFVSAENMTFSHDWLVGVYILGIIFWTIAHAGALHFNPIMGLLGYHFYQVRNGDGMTQLLISRSDLRRPGIEVDTVRVAQHIYLHIGGKHA